MSDGVRVKRQRAWNWARDEHAGRARIACAKFALLLACAGATSGPRLGLAQTGTSTQSFPDVSGSAAPAPVPPATAQPTAQPSAQPTAPSDGQEGSPAPQPVSPPTGPADAPPAPVPAAPAEPVEGADVPATALAAEPAAVAPPAPAEALPPTAGGQPAATLPPAAVEERLPPREDRPFAVWGSMGWNSLAGIAFGASYSFTPHFTADAALGTSAVRLKTGARFRYNLFDRNWTPTFGVGFQYGVGSGGKTIPVDSNNDADDAEVIVERSAFVQAIAGMTYQAYGGFNALFGVGYSVLLDDTNVQLVSGSERTADIVRLLTGSGIVLEAALGYAF